MAEAEAALLSPSLEQLRETKVAVCDYDFIRWSVVDMNGAPRGVLLPAEAAAKSLQAGIGISSDIHAHAPTMRVVPKEVREHHVGNVQAIPDLSTLHPVPWVDGYRVGQIMAETFWNSTTPQEACTRNMARRMLSKLDNMGLRFYSGMELEFTLMNQETEQPVFSGDRNRLMLLQAEYEPWFYTVASNMKKAGVCVGTMHIEYNPGQFEFTTQPQFGIAAADSAVILKRGIKEMATQRGWHANFMTKPFLDEPGNAGHFNFSVWHNEENYFWDESTEDNISKFGKHWIAGMIHHAKALTALGCITTNCYRALHTALVPHQANWGLDDRTAMLRVKNNNPEYTYVENRLSSSPFNPYLVMAATIAAGLDGVVRKLPCPAPHDVSEAVELPHSLKEALDCLQEDSIMVEALGETFIEWFVQTKTEADLKIVEGKTDNVELIELERKQYAYVM